MTRNATRPDLSLTDIERLLRTRQRELDALLRRRKRLERRLAALDVQLARLDGGGGGNSGGRRTPAFGTRGARVRNETPLPESILAVLTKAKGPMSVGEIVESVLAGGYRSNSGNFRGVVNQALVKDARFVGVSRGMYALNGRSK